MLQSYWLILCKINMFVMGEFCVCVCNGIKKRMTFSYAFHFLLQVMS